MGLVLLLGISHQLAEVLPETSALDWPAISQHIAAGKLEVLTSMGLARADAQAALRHGTGWAMLFAGIGACGLAWLSGYFSDAAGKQKRACICRPVLSGE